MDQEINDIREMLLAVTRSLVDHPEDLRIRPESENRRVTFWVYARPGDTGKLIGANGRMARALRAILQANAAKLNLQLFLNICPPEESGMPDPCQPNSSSAPAI
jgi:hypothetical protein